MGVGNAGEGGEEIWMDEEFVQKRGEDEVDANCTQGDHNDRSLGGGYASSSRGVFSGHD
jgi:hypothetical protein